MKDTPETDKNTWSDSSDGVLYNVVTADFARKLERERDEARALLIRIYNDINVLHTGDAIRELTSKFRDENFN